MTAKPGPLSGLTVVEMAGLGPVPLAGLILSEMGADVIRIERLRTDRAFLSLPPEYDLDRHGREILRVDLKQALGVELVLRLVEKADALIEGFRPGVMEKLGLGPEIACARNPGLIYGRMTGFGQTGPMAQRAGHDLTYLAYTGILHAIGQKGGRPVPPLNLVADYGGGTMLLITGMLAALFERFKSGRGQVIDAAMVDGASMLATPFFGFMAAGLWQDRRGENLLDSGAPFYDTYETADGKHIAVACLEPQFFAEFCRLLPLDQRFAEAQYDKSQWDEMREAIATRVRVKSRDEWGALFEDTDACVAPVLSLKEAPNHQHNRARQAHVEAGALLRPSPAPRFSRSGTQAAMPVDSTSATILSRFGISGTEIETLAKEGIVGK
ncbi:CaiB/BaiF CoA-transferase family protein [Mesorhizobium sp. YR577]|uniref:CaiB/BaiF CoA transferase family protein n=1 Tax=Mesorhizobium sp. YR577 TaxID=1884373 RepID=UPI0008EEAB3C|nr:CaiB/BaiF CoA-transferase family protein [Mesorhizobium sp. YR577]SFU22172.1 alpha-methylacyl-CoA racemase [Mesorhizobium sp. YR577]